MRESELEVVYRFSICMWAYGWTAGETKKKIQDFLFSRGLDEYFQRERDARLATENLILEITSREEIVKRDNLLLLEESKNRGYGNKYIKRKYRY